MRTSYIHIGGKMYMLCMSNRVLTDLEAKGQSMQEFLSDDKKTITNICWLIRRMSEAGHAYSKLCNIGDFEAITEDEIMDSSGSDDYEEYMRAILEAAGGERKVDAEPPKNAEAAHAEAQNG